MPGGAVQPAAGSGVFRQPLTHHGSGPTGGKGRRSQEIYDCRDPCIIV